MDLVRMLRKQEKPNAYIEAFYKNTGETEEHFRATEKVLGLEEGTLYDRTRLSTQSINRDKKAAAEAEEARQRNINPDAK